MSAYVSYIHIRSKPKQKQVEGLGRVGLGRVGSGWVGLGWGRGVEGGVFVFWVVMIFFSIRFVFVNFHSVLTLLSELVLVDAVLRTCFLALLSRFRCYVLNSFLERSRCYALRTCVQFVAALMDDTAQIMMRSVTSFSPVWHVNYMTISSSLLCSRKVRSRLHGSGAQRASYL